MKYHLKRRLRELCRSDVCCRILRMLEEGDKITSENLADEIKLDIELYGGVNQQKSGEQNL